MPFSLKSPTTFLALAGLALALASESGAAPQFPFPRNRAYEHGIVTKGGTAQRTELQALFANWNSGAYYERGDRAVIFPSWDWKMTELEFQSSDIGYGMLIMVHMDNAANNTQPKFDKLLNTYDAYLDPNGLMNWRILWRGAQDSVVGSYAATDADMNVAFALLLASRQWNEPRYLTRAKELIGRIWDHEVDSVLTLKPGDDWNPYKSTGYLNFPALHLFAQVDSHDWSSVLRNSWTMLQKNTSTAISRSRLPSDWCLTDGTPTYGNNWASQSIGFHSEALRVPLHAGLAWAWFGDTQALAIDSNIAAFALSPKYSIQGQIDSIGYKYGLSGSRYGYPHPYFLAGAFTTAGMVHSRFQSWVDTGYAYLMRKDPDQAYQSSVYLLASLFMSGNFNNYWDSTAFKPVGLQPRADASAPRIVQQGRSVYVDLPTGKTAASVTVADPSGRFQAWTSANLPDGRQEIRLPPHARGLYLLRWRSEFGEGAVKIHLAD